MSEMIRGAAILSVAISLPALSPVFGGAIVLTDFQPSHLKSGPVKEVNLKTPALTLVDSHRLAFHPPGTMVRFSFAEPVWVIAYETEIEDARGQPPGG